MPSKKPNDFNLLKQAMKELEVQEPSKKIPDKPKIQITQENEENEENKSTECSHKNIIEEKGMGVCIDCGEEVEEKIDTEKEWRYYGYGDNKHGSDPTRTQMRKSEERTIYKDVENMGLSENIINKANKLYTEVVKGKIYRGNFRKSIIFACVFHAFKLNKNPQSHDRLIGLFNLSRKTGLKGLKFVNLNAPKNSKIRVTYITPIDLMGDIMDNFSATEDQKKEVISIYNSVKDKSVKLNRSRPMSYSAGVVFYWILQKKKNITLKEFSKKVSLSELTINRIAKEIASILKVSTREIN